MTDREDAWDAVHEALPVPREIRETSDGRENPGKEPRDGVEMTEGSTRVRQARYQRARYKAGKYGLKLWKTYQRSGPGSGYRLERPDPILCDGKPLLVDGKEVYPVVYERPTTYGLTIEEVEAYLDSMP